VSVPNLTVYGLEIPADVHSLAGFRAWVRGLSEDHRVRATYASGEVFVDVSPQSYKTHEPLVEAINRVLLNLADALGLGHYYLPPSWITAGELVSTEPDGFLVLWERLRSGAVRVNPENEAELLGRPDMTLEVVSRSSTRKDLEVLVRDYAQAGVQEYWIADARHDALDFRIQVLTEDGYVQRAADEEGWISSPLWRREFRLTRVTNPAGHPDFRLEAREAEM
jgi:Uma2 family endonuclease